MATKEQFRAWALKQVGTTERPARSNCQPYSKLLGRPCQAWCADALIAGARTIGLALPSESAYTPTLAHGFQVANRWTEGRAGCQPGAFGFCDFPDSEPGIQHVIWVDSPADPAGNFFSFEGNTSPTDAGSQDMGGGFYRKHRNLKVVVGFGMPNYGAPPVPAPQPHQDPPPLVEDMMIVAPSYLPRGAGGRVAFFELRPVSEKTFVVVAFNDAPLLHKTGTTPSGLPFTQIDSATGHALGIAQVGDAVVVCCANGGTYDVGHKP